MNFVGRRFAGKTALVTGAARRIGRAVSSALAASGADVVIHYSRSARAAEALAAELATLGVRAHPLQADLAVPEQAEALLARACELAGPIELLVNNASMFEPEPLETATLERLVQNVTVNSWAPFVLTRALARQHGRGKVVNLLDTRVTALDLAHVGYILSKHVLAVITRMAAVAFAPGLLVNAVAPGLILPPQGQDETYLARLARDLPLRRHGAPEDVARAVLFLLESDFITGQVVFVDGGSHLLEAHP
jgi:NAD(P)-dependent dehydrogenase (short-subunit alcohol dehydrogenase family)